MKIVYGVFVVLAACCLVFSQGTATTAKPVIIAKMESIKILKGVIVSVDTAAKAVIVKSWQTVDTIIVNESTIITVGIKETVKLADLKADDEVTVYYKLKKGSKTALRIIINVMAPAVHLPADEAGSK